MPSPSSSSLSQERIAAVLHGPRDIRIQSRPVWPPSYGEVQIKLSTTGLCGSDLHYYLHARNGSFAVKSPLVLGHESSGIITSIGPGVSDLCVGQRVVIEPGIMCRKLDCKFCQEGRYNLCPEMRFCSSAKTFPHSDGTLQEVINHPAHVVHPIPEELPLDVAALAEPLSVLLHAASRVGLTSPSSSSSSSSSSIPPLPQQHSNPKPRSVLVFGVGTIGILASSLSKSHSIPRICAIDIDSNRLDFAKASGWVNDTYTLPLPSKGTVRTMEDSKRCIEDAMEYFQQPDGFDLVFECTGVESCIQMAVFGAAVGSKILLVGMGSQNIHLPISSAATREVDLIGCFRYAGTWSKAVELLSNPSKPLGDISRLITHRFSLDRAKEAFELMVKGRDEQGRLVLKVLIENDEEWRNH